MNEAMHSSPKREMRCALSLFVLVLVVFLHINNFICSAATCCVNTAHFDVSLQLTKSRKFKTESLSCPLLASFMV